MGNLPDNRLRNPDGTLFSAEQIHERKNIKGREWRRDNPEKTRQMVRRYRDGKGKLNAAKRYERVRFFRQTNPRYKFSEYKSNSTSRRLGFQMSYDDFLSFWQKPCFYCHRPISTIGLDRVDNSIGYRAGNVVSCCKPCNWAKSKMSSAEFVSMCVLVARFHGQEVA